METDEVTSLIHNCSLICANQTITGVEIFPGGVLLSWDTSEEMCDNRDHRDHRVYTVVD